FTMLYAVKANPHPAILKTMAQLNLGADVASKGELRAALEAGIPASKIEFSGPGKTHDELREAISQNIGSINVESLEELKQIVQLGREHNLHPHVGLRINPGAKIPCGMSMAGASQFGVPFQEIESNIDWIRSQLDAVNFSGVHVHLGSQILDAGAMAESISLILDLALRIEDLLGRPLQKINVGGGWGIDYFSQQEKLDLELLSLQLQSVLNSPRLKTMELKVEPGRFLVAESGVYATQILYTKQNQNRFYAIVDGGMHQNYLLAGGMGQIIKRNFEMDILPRKEREQCPEYSLTVAGKLCTPQDVLADQISCNVPISPGDSIVFFNSGAYGLTASPIHFLSHDKPAEVFYDAELDSA
ncbi:MAG: pyridoxal-dependent decarboxylase, exosortase A system-associated, partial [Candidatus Hinthialibacter sp.]